MTLAEARAKLNLEEMILPAGSSNRPGTRITPTHITIHNTANSDRGADARMHGNYMRGADARRRKVSWHYSVDDKRCIKHLPHGEMGFHAGRGNGVSLGIEVCQNSDGDRDKATERAALLVAVLMHDLGIRDVGKVVTHNSWTGKDCPAVILHRFQGGFTRFRELVKRHFGEIGAVAGGTVAGEPPLPDREADTTLPPPTVVSRSFSFTVGTPGTAAHEVALRDAGGEALADEGAVAEMEAATDEAGSADQDRIALLERLLGQKEAEIAQLRAALLHAESMLLEAD